MGPFAKPFPWGTLCGIKAGSGPPVVFVHGAGNDATVWEGVVRELEPHFTCYTLDLPGHGSSSYWPCDGVEDYASVVLAFLDEEDLKGVILVGHSMGGAIAQRVAPFSRRVSALLLIGTAAKIRVHPRLLTLVEEDFAQGVELLARWAFPKGTPEQLVEGAKGPMWRCGKAVLRQDLRACLRFSSKGDLHLIRVPTLILCGDRDVMTPPEVCRELLDIPGAELRVVQGAGHMIPLERPEEVAEAIRVLWEKVKEGGKP